MIKALILILLSTFCNASWIENYQQGKFTKQNNKIYALVQIDLENNNYKDIAFKEAISDISNQLYSHVISEQSINNELIEDEYSENFRKQIYVTSDLPIFGTQKEKETTYQGKYYLLLTLDKDAVSSTYKDKANDLKYELDKIYKDYLNTNNLDTKEKILNLLSQKLESYEKFSFIAKILNEKDILKPNITPYTIDKELRELYNVTATDIKNLATIISKQITKNNISKAIKLYPYLYEDEDTFSKFSHELKNYLETALTSKVRISNDIQSTLKIRGNYFIEKGFITVYTKLYDENGEILVSLSNKMKLKDFNKNYYVPKKNDFDKMNNLVLNPNLDVQVRMNNSQKNLSFKNGQSVKIEVKVSKESYIYLIGNLRTKENEQIQYLLPISEGNGKNKYIQHIPYQNSNLWINIGEFEISPPFGVEVLHVFATNINIVDKLPLIEEIEIDGAAYDLIVDENDNIISAEESISKTRGLTKKKVVKALEQSEAILRFTTVNSK